MDDLNLNIPQDDEELNKPIPFDLEDTAISNAPLSLDSRTEPKKPTVKKPTVKITSTDRITGVKTFFTKLHSGSLSFLDEQINSWLKENPGVTVKRTNTVTGDVISKKTEPNIIVTIWY